MPELQEARVQSLGREDPQEESTATHSITLAWDIPCPWESHGQRSLAGYSPWGRKELDATEATEHTGFSWGCCIIHTI